MEFTYTLSKRLFSYFRIQSIRNPFGFLPSGKSLIPRPLDGSSGDLVHMHPIALSYLSISPGKIHIATYAHDFITYLITLQIGGGDGYQ